MKFPLSIWSAATCCRSPSTRHVASFQSEDMSAHSKMQWRSVTQFALAAMVLLATFGAMAQTTNALSDAEIQGRQLAQKLLDQRPSENFTNTGVMTIRDAKSHAEFSLICKIIATPTNWMSIYETTMTSSNGFTSGTRLKIVHADNQPDDYTWSRLYSAGSIPVASGMGESSWSGTQWIRPFPGSDFWAVDFGLEFLHWPGQKVLRGDTARGRLCKVLESTNPDPSANGYSRVLCWIDNESLGIVEAKAYDAQGKLLKEFYPKDIKKVDGQWQMGSMEIDNVQTGSRTWLKFDLKSK